MGDRAAARLYNERISQGKPEHLVLFWRPGVGTSSTTPQIENTYLRMTDSLEPRRVVTIDSRNLTVDNRITTRSSKPPKPYSYPAKGVRSKVALNGKLSSVPFVDHLPIRLTPTRRSDTIGIRVCYRLMLNFCQNGSYNKENNQFRKLSHNSKFSI